MNINYRNLALGVWVLVATMVLAVTIVTRLTEAGYQQMVGLGLAAWVGLGLLIGLSYLVDTFMPRRDEYDCFEVPQEDLIEDA